MLYELVLRPLDESLDSGVGSRILSLSFESAYWYPKTFNIVVRGRRLEGVLQCNMGLPYPGAHGTYQPQFQTIPELLRKRRT